MVPSWRTHPRKEQNLRKIGDSLLCPKAPSILNENALPFDAAWTERAVPNFSPHPPSPGFIPGRKILPRRAPLINDRRAPMLSIRVNQRSSAANFAFTPPPHSTETIKNPLTHRPSKTCVQITRARPENSLRI